MSLYNGNSESTRHQPGQRSVGDDAVLCPSVGKEVHSVS